MGIVGEALAQASNTFGKDSSTGIFLGFVFLTIFCGFIPLVVSYALTGRATKEIKSSVS
tara:strand:- start:464 stop:640 length:177 start_codon:yes stop_codon:yes gene_type:complete